MPNIIHETLTEDEETALRDAMAEAHMHGLADIWPRVNDIKEVEYVIVPLDRLGAAPGFSGSKVVIAYYADAEKQYHSSRPLVVKIGEPKKLDDEYQNGSQWAQIAPPQNLRFATPRKKPFPASGMSVLLSPFSSLTKRRAGTGTRYDMKIDDLWRRLIEGEKDPATPGEWGKACACVEDLMQLMQDPHEDGVQDRTLTRKRLSYLDEYRPYLRGAHDPESDRTDNTKLISDLFGDADRTTAFNREWPNPSHVLRRLLADRPEFEGATGCVHGDLHPRNVVLDDHGMSNVIDFGWAKKGRHVIVDYVMLDINVRAMNAPSQVHPDDVLSLASFLLPTGTLPTGMLSLKRRAELIETSIWAAAKPFVQDWTTEYVTPLFLVAFGLLVYMDSARSQAALKATVLASAEHIERSLNGVKP